MAEGPSDRPKGVMHVSIATPLRPFGRERRAPGGRAGARSPAVSAGRHASPGLQQQQQQRRPSAPVAPAASAAPAAQDPGQGSPSTPSPPTMDQVSAYVAQACANMSQQISVQLSGQIAGQLAAAVQGIRADIGAAAVSGAAVAQAAAPTVATAPPCPTVAPPVAAPAAMPVAPTALQPKEVEVLSDGPGEGAGPSVRTRSLPSSRDAPAALTKVHRGARACSVSSAAQAPTTPPAASRRIRSTSLSPIRPGAVPPLAEESAADAAAADVADEVVTIGAAIGPGGP